MIIKETLTETIKAVGLEWVYNASLFVSYWDVNSGSCGEFAYNVLERLPSKDGVEIVSTKNFLDQKGLERYGNNGEFSNHVWLVFEGEHFDIERPNGVNDFMQLPYFQREIKLKELKLSDFDFYLFIRANEKDYPALICNVNEYL